MNVCFHRLNRIMGIVNRGCGARKMVNEVRFKIKKKSNIMPDMFEFWVVQETGNIFFLPEK